MVVSLALGAGCRGRDERSRAPGPSPAPGTAAPAPNLAESPTARLIRSIRAAAPDATVEIVGEFDLKVRATTVGGDDEATVSINTFNLTQACQQNGEEDCAARVEAFTEYLTVSLGGEPAPIDLAVVRATVRDKEYLAQTNALAEPPGRKMVTRPFVGPLHIVYVQDQVATMRFVTRADLEKISVTGDQLHERAMANLRATSDPLETEPVEPGVMMLTGAGDYGSAQLLLHDRWRTLAAAAQGELVAIAVARDVVIVTSTERSDAIDSLIDRYSHDELPYPLEPVPLVWRARGWEVLPRGSASPTREKRE